MNYMAGTNEKRQRNQTYMEINKTFKQSSDHVSSVNGYRWETSHKMIQCVNCNYRFRTQTQLCS